MYLQQYWLVIKNNNKEQQHLILMPSKDILVQITLRFLTLGSQKLKSPSSCHNKKSNEIPSVAKGWLHWGLH